MCQAKCVMCGGDVNDFTGRPDIFELPLGSNERRAVSVEGRLACSYYRYAPPVTCAAILSRRLTEARLKAELDIKCPACGSDNVQMWQCVDCDGGAWSCQCGHEWEDEGEPCRCVQSDE